MRRWGRAAAGAQEQQKLSTQWEELTAPDFVTAIHRSQGVCLLPFGILEKHGPHMPIGTDLINARRVGAPCGGRRICRCRTSFTKRRSIRWTQSNELICN